EIAHENVERFGQVEVREPLTERRACAAQSRFAIAVIGGALLRITQHFVRFGDFLEPLFGLRRFVAIRMKLHGQLAIRLLDLGFAGLALDAQDLVEIAAAAHCMSSSTSRLVWSTRATTLSYGIRVGPSTPITPASGPDR